MDQRGLGLIGLILSLVLGVVVGMMVGNERTTYTISPPTIVIDATQVGNIEAQADYIGTLASGGVQTQIARQVNEQVGLARETMVASNSTQVARAEKGIEARILLKLTPTPTYVGDSS